MRKYIYGLGGLLTILVVAGAGCVSPAPEVVSGETAEEGVVESAIPAPDINVVVPAEDGLETTSSEKVVYNKPAVDQIDSADADEEAVTFAVSGINFAFAPTEIKVKKGQKVTINFTSDMGFHDLVIDELNVRTPQLKSPGTASVTFVADKAGTFEYYCSVGQHRVNGMVGKLVVE